VSFSPVLDCVFDATAQVLVVGEVLLLPDVVVDTSGEGGAGYLLARPGGVDDEWEIALLPDLRTYWIPFIPGIM
jgi:hypothetical protein